MRPSRQNRLDGLGCYLSIRVAGGEGVVVGEDHGFGAVVGEGGFVVAADGWGRCRGCRRRLGGGGRRGGSRGRRGGGAGGGVLGLL